MLRPLARPLLLVAGILVSGILLAAVAVAVARPGDALRTALVDLEPLLATGRLADRAVPLAGLARFDGGEEAPPADAATWRQLLHELRLASVATPAGPDLETVRRRAAELAAAEVVPVAVLDLAYETLRPGALAAGLLTVRDGRLVPAPGAGAAELLDRRQATAAAALDPAIHRGARARFLIPGELLVTDAAVDLSIDLADGAGWRPIRPDRPVVARYAATGPKTVRLRLTAAGGAVRHASFTVEVIARDAPAPSAVWPLTASIPHDGAAASGEAFVYLAEGHAQLTDPVVVVEGFDLDNSLNWPELYELLNRENLLEDLRAAGRDAVVLNFAEATDPIQRNAYLLVELLQRVESEIDPARSYPLVGASMGGLVSRYALSWLEAQGAGHRCELFLSLDAPHAGAVIPLGLQCWLEFFQGESADAAYLLSRLDTVAARQMLLYHHLALAGTSAQPDPAAAAFASDLAGLGDWPAAPRLVAVANGSGAGQDQGFAPGGQLIDYEYGSLLVDIVGNVWAVPDGSTQVIFDGLIDLIWPLPDSEWTVTVGGTAPWDGAPGGFRTSMAQMDTTSVPYGDITALHDAHAFIPTVSAVALAGADPFTDLGAVGDFPPFDAVYLPAANQEHVLITAENRGWIMDEILGTSTAVEPGATPAALQLHGARPNPFNPRTEIGFALPHAGAVRLWIADARGRRVRTLLARELPAGEHAVLWNGRDDRGRGLASGVYLAVVEQADSRIARRLTLVR